MEHTSKTIRIENGDFSTHYGVEYKDDPKAIWLKYSTWVTPNDNYDFKSIAAEINKDLRQLMYYKCNTDMFKADRTIVDTQIPFKLLEPLKSSYIFLEITFYQTGRFPIDSDVVRIEMNKLIEILNTYLYSSKYFSYNLTKL